ncbi:hypothetical protein [Catellatospora chokoriensis]|nr:hypothetical protein [Catellatospora chokoriensis]
MTSTASQEPIRLVYGHAQLHDSLAFADATTAAAEAAEIEAIATATTWGEARGLQTRHVSNPVAFDDPDDDPNEEPDDAAFDINEVNCVVEGDWPPMVTARAFDLLPEDLQARFGSSDFTALNGDFLNIPVEREAELIGELRNRGIEVTRDDALINVLDGRSRGTAEPHIMAALRYPSALSSSWCYSRRACQSSTPSPSAATAPTRLRRRVRT